MTKTKEIEEALNTRIHGVYIKDIPYPDLINLKNDKIKGIKKLDRYKDKLKLQGMQRQIHALELIIKNS